MAFRVSVVNTKEALKKCCNYLFVIVKQQAFLGATIRAHRDGSWIHRCFSLNLGRIIDLPSWAALREREQYKWKASRTLESSPRVPVYWATNTPLGLRLALITPRRHRTTLFVSFHTTFHPHKLSLTALFLSFPAFCYLLPLSFCTSLQDSRQCSSKFLIFLQPSFD